MREKDRCKCGHVHPSGIGASICGCGDCHLMWMDYNILSDEAKARFRDLWK